MSAYLILVVIIAVGVLVAIGGVLLLRRDDLSVGGIASVLVGPIVALTALVLLVAVPASARYSHSVCDRFAAQTDRPTKFAHYGFWSWDCLTQTDEGWVSIDRIFKVDE